MGDKTGISWTDATWSPARGCSRISEGCRNCYAERIAARFSDPGQPFHGFAVRHTAPRDSLDQVGGRRAGWTRKVEFQPDQLAIPLRWKKPRRIFCSSMTDIFHEELTNEQIAAVFGVMAASPQHTFQVLTKRARRMREWFEWIATQDCDPHTECHAAALLHDDEGTIHTKSNNAFDRPWPLPNVHLGVSTENQPAFDERWPELFKCPAAVRWFSAEPLIGGIDMTHMLADFACKRGKLWLVAGCESGPGARPCDIAWFRSLRDRCATAGVPYFLKQGVTTGAEFVAGPGDGHRGLYASAGSKRKAGGVIELPYLDGVQHAAFPEPTR